MREVVPAEDGLHTAGALIEEKAPISDTDLLALAKRCETERPNWVLCGDIEVALCDGVTWWRGAGPFLVQKGGRPYNPPAYAFSLDAAASLMKGNWGLAWDIESVMACGESGIDGVGVCAYVWLDHPTYEETYCRSPACRTHAEAMAHVPLLICRAALHARVTEGQADTEEQVRSEAKSAP